MSSRRRNQQQQQEEAAAVVIVDDGTTTQSSTTISQQQQQQHRSDNNNNNQQRINNNNAAPEGASHQNPHQNGEKLPQTTSQQSPETNNNKKENASSSSSSVLGQLLLVIPAVLILGFVTAVLVIDFEVADNIKETSVEREQQCISVDVKHVVQTFFEEKTRVIRNHAYLYSSGQRNVDSMIVHPRWDEVDKVTHLPNPTELQEYEVATVPFFHNDPDLVAMYNAMSNEQTWKIHQEVAGQLTTQLRFAGTVNGSRYYERYERIRYGLNDRLDNFTLATHKFSVYSPYEQGWYLRANVSSLYDPITDTYRGLWEGPDFQGTGAGAGSYGLEPVMTYNRRVDWAPDPMNPTGPKRYSVFKLKVLTSKINQLLLSLTKEGRDIVIVNTDGEIAAYSKPGLQVIPDEDDPTNAKKATFKKVWTLEGGRFSSLTADALKNNETWSQGDLAVFPLHEFNSEWRLVVYVDGNVLQRPYASQLNLLIGMGITLLILSILCIIYAAVNIRWRLAEAEEKAKLMSDIAQRAQSEVDLALAVTDMLLDYDTEGMRAVIEEFHEDSVAQHGEDGASQSVPLTEAFEQMANNLDKYRPFIPNWMLDNASGGGDGAVSISGGGTNANSGRLLRVHSTGLQNQKQQSSRGTFSTARRTSRSQQQHEEESSDSQRTSGRLSSARPHHYSQQGIAGTGRLDEEDGTMLMNMTGGDNAKTTPRRVTIALIRYEFIGQSAADSYSQTLDRFAAAVFNAARITNGAVHAFCGYLTVSWNAISTCKSHENNAGKFTQMLQREKSIASDLELKGAVMSGPCMAIVAGDKNKAVSIDCPWIYSLHHLAALAENYKTILIDQTTQSRMIYDFSFRALDGMWTPTESKLPFAPPSSPKHNDGGTSKKAKSGHQPQRKTSTNDDTNDDGSPKIQNAAEEEQMHHLHPNTVGEEEDEEYTTTDGESIAKKDEKKKKKKKSKKESAADAVLSTKPQRPANLHIFYQILSEKAAMQEWLYDMEGDNDERAMNEILKQASEGQNENALRDLLVLEKRRKELLGDDDDDDSNDGGQVTTAVLASHEENPLGAPDLESVISTAASERSLQNRQKNFALRLRESAHTGVMTWPCQQIHPCVNNNNNPAFLPSA